MNPVAKPRIYSVGHGNAPFQEIERILRLHGVATIIDVRSAPYSKFSPDFRKSALAEHAAAAGLGYRWMGDRLGATRSGTVAEDAGSMPEPGADESAVFGALAEVIALNQTGPIALLCAERDPAHCHRLTSLAPLFEALDCEVFHILSDGSAHRHQPSLGI